jgi:hypothetical protein
MSTRKQRAPRAQPIGAAQALQILFSAVGYVMRSGLRCQAGNIDGRLVLYITGARVEYAGDKAQFLVTALDQAGTAQAAGATTKTADVTTAKPEPATADGSTLDR